MNRAEIEKLLVWLLPTVVVAALADAALMKMINQMLSQVGTTVTQSVDEMSWLDRNFTLGKQITYLNILKAVPDILTRIVIGSVRRGRTGEIEDKQLIQKEMMP